MRDLAGYVRPRIVRIEARSSQQGSDGVAVGSGFLVSQQGHILTCWHCIAQFSTDPSGFLQYEYRTPIRAFWKGTQYPATVVHRSSTDYPYTTDFAVLKIGVEGTPFLELGDYEEARQGDQVCFMGYPFGSSELYFGSGHIAALCERQSVQNQLVRYDVMELDASINKGNSGGPVLHANSRKVVGIVAMRHGSITRNLELLRDHLGRWPGSGGILETGMTELIDLAEQFTNVGLGTAVSIRYAKDELTAIGALV